MVRKLTVIVAVVVAVAALPVVAGEDLPQAKKYDSQEWFLMVHVQFEAGQAEKALKIVKDKFAPAAKASGFKMPKVFQCRTGEWDVIYIFHLQDGVSEMEWQISPMDAKWFAAFAEQEGSMEAAQKVYTEYDELIEDWQTELVRWVDMSPAAEETSE